jgi:hypothetical protein
MKKIAFFSIIILVFALCGLNAQSRDFATYVSQIKAETRNNLVRITWVDSPDARGPVYIYRSARPFSGSVPVNIRPIVVRYGLQYYIDEVEDMNSLFYFVAASDLSGQRYETIIHQINSISVNLVKSVEPVKQTDIEQIDNEQLDIEKPEIEKSISPVSVFEQLHVVTDIWTRREGNRVIITYTSTSPEKNAVLFRSAYPLSQPNDLINAFIVQSGISSPFIDVPVPGISWYYAIIYEDDILSGNIRIRPGFNATASAVVIHDENTAENFMRPIPLPGLTLNNYISGGFLADVVKEKPLSTASLNMIRLTQKNDKPPLELKWPRVFTMDLAEPQTGEESALYQILEDHFKQFEWENARNNLQEYLALPRTYDVQARARFYLGQTQYFTGNYKEALWEFLSFRSINPDEANSWIDAVLAAMVY